MKITQYLRNPKFFADYLPGIKNIKMKMRGKNSKGNPIDFSPKEKRAIRAAIKKMWNDKSLFD